MHELCMEFEKTKCAWFQNGAKISQIAENVCNFNQKNNRIVTKLSNVDNINHADLIASNSTHTKFKRNVITYPTNQFTAS